MAYKHKVRKPLIAGNWKMNDLKGDARSLAKSIALETKKIDLNCEVLICPPFTVLSGVKNALWGSNVKLGAQDCSWAENGAHTGDISPVMLKEVGCEYVILGHSERRTDHKETSSMVRSKAKAAHKAGLRTIICIGETLAEREAGLAKEVCEKQIMTSVPKESNGGNTVIAYEPVWAIGTGKTPTPDEVEDMHAFIRSVLVKKLGAMPAVRMRILYGGSMKPSNAEQLLSLKDVDGGLIGGASLKVEDFMSIIKKVK